MSLTSKSALPCVCFIEDDRVKRRILVDEHDAAWSSTFDIRFIICEQQFWDIFDRPTSGQCASNNPRKEYPAGAILYSPEVDSFPAVFVVDMMLQWTSKYYDSGRIQPEDETKNRVNRAGIRIGQHMHYLSNCRRFYWFYWTVIDCENIRAKLEPVDLCYKDSHSTQETLEKIGEIIRRSGG
jgi:hypothetical protein